MVFIWGYLFMLLDKYFVMEVIKPLLYVIKFY